MSHKFFQTIDVEHEAESCEMVQEAKSLRQKGQLPARMRILALRFGFVCLVVLTLAPRASGARFIAYFPLAANTPKAAEDVPNKSPSKPTAATSQESLSANVSLPVLDSSVSESLSQSWQIYCDTWRRHHRQPDDAKTRAQLGIPEQTIQVAKSSGRATAAALRLPPGAMQRFESPQFVLLTDVRDERAGELLIEFEKFHSVWTQLFFPLWRERDRWDQSVKSSRPRVLMKHRVVLFKESVRYAELLQNEGPGVGQSTGFYSDLKRVTFLTDDAAVAEDEKRATRFHELTHQLLTEATDAKARQRPGEREEFWLVEGIACYMESTMLQPDHATVGGWQASRLQFARHRVLASGDDIAWNELTSSGRVAVQGGDDLPRWYSFATAYTQRMIDEDNGLGLLNALKRLAAIYQLRTAFVPGTTARDSMSALPPLSEYLKLDDSRITPVGTSHLKDLCLTRTSVTPAGLQAVEPQSELRWLDLSFLQVTTKMVTRLSPNSASLEQLSLEATLIDDSVGVWLRNAERLRELDLSSTRVSDLALAELPLACPLETLWLTGSQVSDTSIDRIASMKSLERVDVQRTLVTDGGLQRLRTLRPDLQINPLELAGP